MTDKIYGKTANKLLVLTGPPSDNRDDEALARIAASHDGPVIICGGITAQIIARELGRELTVKLGKNSAALPPVSSMEGIDLVTEGVLTLGKVKRLLEYLPEQGTVSTPGPAGDVARMLLAHNDIEFIVGTCMNPAYQNVNLPAGIELREELVNSIVRLLKSEFHKKVKVRYF